MISWKKIQEKVFLVDSSETKKQFLVRTLPFGVYNVHPDTPNSVIHTYAKQCFQINEESSGYKSYFAVDVILTTMCNFRCVYCCALSKNSELYYGLSPRNMNIITAQKMIEITIQFFEKELKKDKDSKNGTFDVFLTGGEPLLNFITLRYIVKLYKDEIKHLSDKYHKHISLNIEVATNGSLITEEVAIFFHKYDVQSAITIDGPRHDQRRAFKGGKGSLEAVLSGLRCLIKHENKIKLQTVVPISDTDYIKKTIDFYKSLGLLSKVKRVHIIPEAKSIRDRYLKHTSGENLDIQSYNMFSKTLMDLSAKHNLDIKNYQGRLLRSMQIGGLPYRCSAGQWKIAITPDGSIYPCHQLTNIKEFYMGNVLESQHTLQHSMRKISNIFQRRTVFKVNPCKDCLFQTICIPFVDCPARCFIEGGDLYTVPDKYCEIHKPYMEKLMEHFFTEKLKKEADFEAGELPTPACSEAL